MKNLNLEEFKEKLEGKEKSELISEISMLCEKFHQVKEYYHAQEDGAANSGRRLWCCGSGSCFRHFSEAGGEERQEYSARLGEG